MTPNGTTRAALLTPPGAGAIGVIRVTGSDAHSVVAHVFRPTSKDAVTASLNMIQYGTFVADEQVIDDGVCSFTDQGDKPTIDLCTHGGVRIMERLLGELERLGASISTGVRSPAGLWCTDDPIQQGVANAFQRARTARGVRFLARQYQGLARVVSGIASIVESDPGVARALLKTLLDGSDAAGRLIDGATVTIVGPANSGKSTLFNTLLGRRAAVVTDTEGTTRDWIKESIEIDGVSIEIMDTPGVRTCAGALERKAFTDAQEHVASADLRLVVFDVATPMAPHTIDALTSWTELGPHVLLGNKADLGNPSVFTRADFPFHGSLPVSALTGHGLDRVCEAIVESLGISVLSDDCPALISQHQTQIAKRALVLLDQGDPTAAAAVRELFNDAQLGDDR